MLDEDIQYIGSRNTPRDCLAALNRPFTDAHPQVTGIKLHVEKSGAEPGYAMSFLRSNTSVVYVGRRPGSDYEGRSYDEESGKAMFRCAVVSRKHAKIAFADGGHVYLIDLNSHHGTHLRKSNETISRMLNPETPTTIADGDTITFGKSVGKNNEFVRPVVVRVELLLRSPADRLPKPLVVPTTYSAQSAERSDSSSPSSSSGRYGVYVSSSSSSRNSSPRPDHDSDIEEIPPPVSSASQEGSSNALSLGRTFEALKRLLPPVHPPPFYGRQAVAEPVPLLSPPIYLSSYDSSHHYSAYEIGADRWFSTADVVEERVYDVQSEGHQSRSTSPMDLSSPSPAPSAPSHIVNSIMAAEPVVVGAWPLSRFASPAIAESQDAEPSALSSARNIQITAPVSTENGVRGDEAVSQPAQPSELPVSSDEAHFDDVANDAPSASIVAEASEAEPANEQQNSELLEELKGSVNALQNEVAKLQVHRRKCKSRFNSNVHIIADKLTDLDERVNDVHGMYTALSDQMDSISHVDLADMQVQLDAMQEQVDVGLPSFWERFSGSDFQQKVEVDELVATLRGLVAEMQTLREMTQAQMAAEVEAVRAAGAEALAGLLAQAPASPLKRKRSDDADAVEGAGGDASMRVDGEPGVDGGAAAETTADPGLAGAVSRAVAATTVVATDETIYVPSPKRARRVFSAIAHTAAAATVGAVAAWSALAFS